MGNDFAESARQSYVVMKNEIKKYFSGKRMLVFAILLAVIVFVITVAPYIFGSKANPVYFYMLAQLVVLMAATLFASISVVSEYEERTALIVFTRPIRKGSIFIGKVLACIILTVAFTILYYIIAAIVGLCVNGSIDADILTSLGLACAYAFGAIGVAVLISSLMKKGSTSTIITFVVLAIIVVAMSMVLNAANVDSSFMIDQSADSIMTCSQEYRDMTNEALKKIYEDLMTPSKFVKFDIYELVLAQPGVTAAMLESALDPTKGAWTLAEVIGDFSTIEVKAPDYGHDAIVMLMWGLIGLIGGFVAFIRREF